MLIQETQAQWFNPKRILAMLLGVDGSGSGLDADMVDGLHASDIVSTGSGSAEIGAYTNTVVTDTGYVTITIDGVEYQLLAKKITSGGTNPDELGGLVLWLDANDSSTLWQDTSATLPVMLDSQSVARWDDKSGNGNNVTQGTTTARPTYRTGIQNSLPALSFDGGDYLDSVATFTSYPLSVFAVVKTSATVGSLRGIVTLLHSTSGGDRLSFSSANKVSFSTVAGGGSGTALSTSTFGANTSVVATGVIDGFNIYAWDNGTKSSSTHTATTVTQKVRVGGYSVNSTSFLMNGYICEVIVYNSALSDDDVNSILSYLNTKWSAY